jgi:hypothetical protein
MLEIIVCVYVIGFAMTLAIAAEESLSFGHAVWCALVWPWWLFVAFTGPT